MDVLGLVGSGVGGRFGRCGRNVQVGADDGASAVGIEAVGVASASGILEAAAELRPVVVEPLQLTAVAEAVIVGHAAAFAHRHCIGVKGQAHFLQFFAIFCNFFYIYIYI